MTKKFLLLIGCLCFCLTACDYSYKRNYGPEDISSKPAEGPGASFKFDYLLYENDYNGVPLDDDPAYYTNEILDSALIGLAYKLTNDRAFAPGVFAIVAPSREKTWYHVSFRALKLSKDMEEPLSARGQVVLSWERSGGMAHYITYSIKELLKRQNRQIIDKWETVELWQEVPKDVKEGDLLKIYVWNPEGGTIYLDDFVVTAWSEQKAPVAEEEVKMRLLVDQGYEHEVPSNSNSISSQYAYRGMYSNVVGNLPDYNAYGKTYLTSLQDAQLQSGSILRIRFAALKQDKIRRSEQVGAMICSVERDGKNLYWQPFGINSRLWEEGEQVIKVWKELEWWQVLPQDLRPTDLLKVYVWNNHGTLIFVDDLSIEVAEMPLE